MFEAFTNRFKHMLSDGDAIAILHMHDGMVCHHPINKQSWTLCILYCQRQCNIIDRISTSTTWLRWIIFLP